MGWRKHLWCKFGLHRWAFQDGKNIVELRSAYTDRRSPRMKTICLDCGKEETIECDFKEVYGERR